MGNAGKYALTKPVFFIGFMGAGKSAVNRRLSKRLGLPAVDCDDHIVYREGRSISQIFATQGEIIFRELESHYLYDLGLSGPKLISCGGGVVERDENVVFMRSIGYVVLLETTPEISAKRIRKKTNRPLFKDKESFEALFDQRLPLYHRAADVSFDTKKHGVRKLVRIIEADLIENGILVKAP